MGGGGGAYSITMKEGNKAHHKYPHKVISRAQSKTRRRGVPPPPWRPAYAWPMSPERQMLASMTLVIDNNRYQRLWHPLQTGCSTAFGTACEVPSNASLGEGGTKRGGMVGSGGCATPHAHMARMGECVTHVLINVCSRRKHFENAL